MIACSTKMSVLIFNKLELFKLAFLNQISKENFSITRSGMIQIIIKSICMYVYFKRKEMTINIGHCHQNSVSHITEFISFLKDVLWLILVFLKTG